MKNHSGYHGAPSRTTYKKDRERWKKRVIYIWKGGEREGGEGREDR